MRIENASPLTQFEVIDGKVLAERWRVTPAWIRKQCVVAENCLPHLKLGRYVRFLWGSPDLCKWMEKHYNR
jgi:hypothetical protein